MPRSFCGMTVSGLSFVPLVLPLANFAKLSRPSWRSWCYNAAPPIPGGMRQKLPDGWMRPLSLLMWYVLLGHLLLAPRLMQNALTSHVIHAEVLHCCVLFSSRWHMRPNRFPQAFQQPHTLPHRLRALVLAAARLSHRMWQGGP